MSGYLLKGSFAGRGLRGLSVSDDPGGSEDDIREFENSVPGRRGGAFRGVGGSCAGIDYDSGTPKNKFLAI